MKFVVLTNNTFRPDIICCKYGYFISKKSNIEIVDCAGNNGEGRKFQIMLINIKTLFDLDELVRECRGTIVYSHRYDRFQPLLPVIYLN